MSTLFADPLESRSRLQSLEAMPTDYSALAPGTFEGLPSALGQGLSRAGASLEMAGVDVAPYLPFSNLSLAYAQSLGMDPLKPAADFGQEWLKASQLDPATHGSVSHILYGVASQAPAIAASFLNPLAGAAVAGGSTFESSDFDLQDQGADAGTARAAAGSDAVLAALGALLPASIGANRLVNTALVGPGINLAQDIGSRYATGAILEANGYDELAGQYRQLDAATLIADVVIGGAFGFAGAKHSGTELDAALTQQAIRARALAGLGTPLDIESQAKHAAALDKATTDLLSDRPVDVTGIEGARFLADPQNALARVLEQNGYQGHLTELRDLETQLAERQIVVPDEDVLPELPVAFEPKPLPKPVAKTESANPDQPKAEPLAPHEEAAVANAEAISAEHAAGDAGLNRDADHRPQIIEKIGKKAGEYSMEAKTEAGFLRAKVSDGVLHITRATVARVSDRGKGVGVSLYRALLDEAFSRGLRVVSDHTVSAPAQRIYEALGRRGYEIRRQRGSRIAKKDSGEEPGTIVGPGDGSSHVFEVRPMRARDVATPEGDVRASTALARGNRAVEKAQTESVQFAAAVNCASRHGA